MLRRALQTIASVVLPAATAIVMATSIVSCGAAIETSKVEDLARHEVPVAICLKEAPSAGGGVMAALRPADYWDLVLPGYDPQRLVLDTTAADCAGRPLFASAKLNAKDVIGAKDEQVHVADVAGNFKVVWLKTHAFQDGDATGPLALVRSLDGRSEVYAIGVFRGPAKATRFDLQRIGPDLLITADDGGCSSVKGKPCVTSMNVLLMRMGRLLDAARFATHGVSFSGAENAPIEHRFSATPDFGADGLVLSEQMVAEDPTKPVVQRSTLKRFFKLDEGGKLITEQPSLLAAER